MPNRTYTLAEFDAMARYSGSVVKTQIQSFYNELIYIVDKGEGYFPTRLHNQSTVLDSRRTLEFGC